MTATKTSFDSRGPVRRIVSVERKTDGDYVTCDCGHTSAKVHADWSHETETRCFKCRGVAPWENK